MNAQPNYTLPDRVTAFLEAGPPPVCVTFGSMMLIRRGKFMQWVLDALRELNQARGARSRGSAVPRLLTTRLRPGCWPCSACSSSLAGRTPPRTCLTLCFPWRRCPMSTFSTGAAPSSTTVRARQAASAWHGCGIASRVAWRTGGAGTSGRVLEAGVPSIVIPILRWTDQPLFGQRAAELGCGACVLKTSYEAVRSAIAYSLDPAGDVPMKARQVGIRIAAENEKAFDRVVLSLEQDTRIQRPSTPRQ